MTLSITSLLLCAWASGVPDAEPTPYHGFSVPIELSGLPAGAGFIPVSCPIDFTEMQKRVKALGVVDERSLRLLRILPDGTEVEEPVQFSATPQPAAKGRRLLPGTGPKVSYTAEHRADETPDVRVAGTLVWIARAGGNATRYRLRFGVPRDGRMIQVPFPPQNLRAFDGQGHAMPIRYFPRMQIRPQWPLDGVVQLFEGNQLVTSYHVGPAVSQAAGPAPAFRRPFLYPVIGPDGVSLTEFGKPHDPTGSHAHHYSLWVAHTSVGGQSFWSERDGIIANERLELQEDGPIFCRIVQGTRWIANNVEHLRERRTLTVYVAAKDFRLMDVELELAPAGTKPVELGQTTFGFLAVRVAQSLTPFDGGGEILNSQGDRNEQNAHTKRAAWLDQSGPVAEGPSASSGIPLARWNGIAMFDHSRNVNHPTVWHCRNDGWACASFNGAGPYTIGSGEKLHLRYRILLHRHNAVQGQVAQRYQEYVAEPAIRIGEPSRETE